MGESHELVVDESPSDRSLESTNPGNVASLPLALDEGFSARGVLVVLFRL